MKNCLFPFHIHFANTLNMKHYFGICIAPNCDLNCYNYCHATPYKHNEMKVLALITCWHNLNKKHAHKSTTPSFLCILCVSSHDSSIQVVSGIEPINKACCERKPNAKDVACRKYWTLTCKLVSAYLDTSSWHLPACCRLSCVSSVYPVMILPYMIYDMICHAHDEDDFEYIWLYTYAYLE